MLAVDRDRGMIEPAVPSELRLEAMAISITPAAHVAFLRDLEQEFEEELDFADVEIGRRLQLLQTGTVQDLVEFINSLERPGRRSRVWQQRVLARVEGAAKLVDFCGYWPSFLDAVF